MRSNLRDRLVAAEDAAPDPDADDARKLVFLMHGQKQPRTAGYFAAKLGWSVERVEELLAKLEHEGSVNSKGGE